MRKLTSTTTPIALFLLALLFLSGCGKKGPVRPLELPLPAAPGKLEVRQLGQRFLVSWEIPATNQDGSPLTDLQGFGIYKMKYDPAKECPECRDTSVLLRQVDLEYLEWARQIGNRIYFWDSELETGAGYQYRVVPLTRRGRKGAPVQARRPFMEPPPAPAGLQAKGLDRMARLSWNVAADPRQGVEWLGYDVYRRNPDEPFPPHPVNHKKLMEPEYDDFGLENDHTYIYTVRLVVRVMGQVIESAAAEVGEALPAEGK